MKNCALCSNKLGLTNTPSFGGGKLIDGQLCLSCFKRIGRELPEISLKLKNYTLEDVQRMLQEKASTPKSTRLDEIKSQIQGLKLNNISAFLGRKEINELPNILAANENIDNIAQGTYNNGQGILVSTNRRLIFIDKGLLYGLRVEDFPLDKITSIQYETGLLLGSVKIHTSGNIALIDNVEKATARQFSEFVRNKLSQPKDSQGNPQIDIAGQIEKLAKLRDGGILTEDEFLEQKKKLLDKL